MRPDLPKLVTRRTMCLNCGSIVDVPRIELLGTNEMGEEVTVAAGNMCQGCRSTHVIDISPRPRVNAEVITQAIRDADMSVNDLQDLAAAVQAATGDISPRALAEQVPSAQHVIVIASRAGRDWLALLGIVIAIVLGYVAHLDAEKASRSADQEPKAERTSELTEHDLRKIAKQVESKMHDTPKPHDKKRDKP